MPTADGKPIFEDLVALLQTKPGAYALAGHIDLITGGLVDLANRVKNLEHASLVSAASAQAATDAVAGQKARIDMIEGDNKDYKGRIEKIEAAPAADSKRLDDLEKRIRTVEGAVGSAGFKAAKEAPAPSAFAGPAATDPVAEHKGA